MKYETRDKQQKALMIAQLINPNPESFLSLPRGIVFRYDASGLLGISVTAPQVGDEEVVYLDPKTKLAHYAVSGNHLDWKIKYEEVLRLSPNKFTVERLKGKKSNPPSLVIRYKDDTVITANLNETGDRGLLSLTRVMVEGGFVKTTTAVTVDFEISVHSLVDLDKFFAEIEDERKAAV